MLLALDIGNSTMAAGLFAGGNHDPVTTGKFPLGDSKKSGGVEAVFMALAASFTKKKKIKAVAVSSVVPELDEALTVEIQKHFSCEPFFLTARSRQLLEICYDEPGQLGVDRIAAATGAFAIFDDDCLVADMGTAATFTVVQDHAIRGGLIAPGIITSLEALSSRASNLFQVDLMKKGPLIATNTEDAIRSGTLAGWASMVEGIYLRVAAHYDRRMLLVLTGGAAGLVHPHIITPCRHEEHLVLKGLSRLFDINHVG